MQLRKAYIAAVMALALLAGGPVLRAQSYTTVRLKVYNDLDKDENGKPRLYEEARVYVFETEAEGMAADRKYTDMVKSGGTIFVPDNVSESHDMFGTGGIITLNEASTEGAIFLAVQGDEKAAKLEKIKGRSEISVHLKVGYALNPIFVTDERKMGGAKESRPIDNGKTVELNDICYLLPQHIGRTDGRFVIQTYLIPADTLAPNRDTLEWRKLVVMDGRDYHKTQLRRMGFNPRNDQLYAIAHETPVLTDSTKDVYLPDTLLKTQAVKEGVLVMGKVWFEDYNHVYFTDDVQLADTRRVSRPMQFLEFKREPERLNPYDDAYIKAPIKARRPGMIQLPIQFEQGQAKVDSKDPASLRMMDSLRHTVYRLAHDPDAVLRQLSVTGIASPEGSYTTNVSLANERVKYIINEAKAQIPADKQVSLRTPVIEARVASWNELADTLAKDGYVEEANQIRAITAKNPGNPDAQSPKIKKLPFYNTLIEDNLHRLRMVHFQWIHEEKRPLNDKEILNKYYTDPEFREGGSIEFTPYEFWVLMQRLSGDDLERICKRAISKDLENKWDRRWILPANVLAASYLERGVVDTTILAPYIQENVHKCDVINRWGEYTYCLNPSAVVANQISMMLRGEYYDRAVDLVALLKGVPKYRMLDAIVHCKAGYWNAKDQKSEEYYNTVRGSSPLNTVIMDMAKGYYSSARFEIEELDPQDPVTLYLKAQLECMDFFDKTGVTNFGLLDDDVQDHAIFCLAESFRRDHTLVDKARFDWDIFKGLFDQALKDYENPTADSGLTEEQKQALINKATFHPGNMTDEEWDLYYNNKLDKLAD